MRLFLTFTLLLILSGCSIFSSGKQIKTQSAQHRYSIAGEGAHTIVMQSGLGDSMNDWGRVVDQLSEQARVITYNRAGFSGSKSKQGLRTAAAISVELKEMLEGLKIPPPYILA